MDKIHKSFHDFAYVPNQQQQPRRLPQTNGQARHNASFHDFQSSKPSSRPLGRKSSLPASFHSSLHHSSVPRSGSPKQGIRRESGIFVSELSKDHSSVPMPGSPKQGIRREAGIFVSESSEGLRRSSIPDLPGQFNPNNIRSEAARDHGHAPSFHSGMSREQPMPSSPRASKHFNTNRPSAARRKSSAFQSSIITLGSLDESTTHRISSSGLDESIPSLRSTGLHDSRSSGHFASCEIDLDPFELSSADDTVSCDGGNSGVETDIASSSDEESPAAVHPRIMDKEQIESVMRKVNLPGGFNDVSFNERSLLAAFSSISLRRRPS